MGLRATLERVPSAAFSFVMATGITGTAVTTLGLAPVGTVAFAVAVAGYLVLLVATVARAFLAPSAVLRDARDPGRAFGFFTFAAATGVTTTLGVALGVVGSPSRALVGALVLETAVWVVLTYGMLPWLVTHTAGRALLPTVDGGWFLVVVATQSLSVLTSAAAGDGRVLALAAFGLWALGVLLYVVLIGAVLVRMLSETAARPDVAPTAWVLTGSTAISTLAATRVLTADVTVLAGTDGAVIVVAMALWSFGTFLIPFLVGLGVRELLSRPASRRFTVGWWSIVFPIGMYATATLAFGRAVDVPAFAVLGTIAAWTGVVAWVLVSVGAVVHLSRYVGGRLPSDSALHVD
jgi:tellurite resistance protein TehA-like permease